MKISTLLLLACFIAQCSFGQTQIPIQSQDSGTLTWTNNVTEIRYRVEWSYSSDGPWFYSWDSLSDIHGGTNYILTAHVPLFYRVTMLPESEHPVITADPSNILTSNGKIAVLTVTGGTPPYSWSVKDMALGMVNPATGYTTVYMRGARGNNVVTVHDSMGDYAFIMIQQP
jgi:hypothetical protein